MSLKVETLRRLWYHLVEPQEFCSKPYASLLAFPQRICHILSSGLVLWFKWDFFDLHTSVEESVSSEDHLLVSILHEPANTVLGMTWRVMSRNINTSDLEAASIGRRLCDNITVFATNDGFAS